jgi:hypothetical protein
MPSQVWVHRDSLDGNHRHQTGLVHNAYTQVVLDKMFLNEGGYWDVTTSRFYPPAGKAFILFTNIWYRENFQSPAGGQTANPTIKFTVNGDYLSLGAVPGWTPAGFPATAGAFMATCGRLNEGDWVQLLAWSNSKNYDPVGNPAPNDVMIDGRYEHTWLKALIFDD